MNEDKAGRAYWDHAWKDAILPAPLNPRLQGIKNYVDRQFHGFFLETFSKMDTCGRHLLELGCAKSSWLPYFATEFAFQISGIDYSEVGCSIARRVLDKNGINGEIVCTDFFSPPESMLGKFDVVVSFGVVEHYQDTAACLAGFAKYLKPGGTIVTVIPNMVGLPGFLQKLLDRDVYDIHVPLDSIALEEAHRKAGFEVLRAGYFLSISLGVVNVESKKGGGLYTLLRSRYLISELVWLAGGIFPVFPANRITSPYINCVAKKPVV